MIEIALYFTLGFLVATLLAFVIMPAVWARAVRLTRRQIEATTPLTRAEILSSRDQIAAEYAVNIRRMEMGIGALRRRVADQMATLTRQGDALKSVAAERDRAVEEAALLSDRLAIHVAKDKGVDLTLERMAKLDADNRRLAEERDLARADLSRIEARTGDVARERAQFQDEVQSLRLKLADFEGAVDERLTTLRAKLAETELELKQARREVEEAKAARMEAAARLSSGASEVAALRTEREALALKLAALQTSLSLSKPDPVGDNASTTIEALEQARAELDDKLRTVMAERDTMQAQIVDLERQVHYVAGDNADDAFRQLRRALTDLGQRFADLAEQAEAAPDGDVGGPATEIGPSPADAAADDAKLAAALENAEMLGDEPAAEPADEQSDESPDDLARQLGEDADGDDVPSPRPVQEPAAASA